MPDTQWYEEATTIIHQIGNTQYQHLVFTWLDFQLENKMAWDAQAAYYWLRNPVKPGITDGIAAMAQVAKAVTPEWYATQDHADENKMSGNVGMEWYPAPLSITHKLSPTKQQRKHALLQSQRPYLLSQKYPLCYTVAGRLLRGILHSAAIVRSPEMLEMVETFGLNCPEYILDVVHIYAQLPLGETVARARWIRDRLRTNLPVWQVESRLRRMGDKHRRSGADIKVADVSTLGFDEHHRLVKELGPYHISLDLLGCRPFEIIWQKDGIAFSDPSPKEEQAAFKVLRPTLRRGPGQLADEIERIEALFTDTRQWNYKDWLPAFILHPFTGAVGKRLIWLFVAGTQAQEAIWTVNGFTAIDGSVLDWINDKTIVSLWHPVMAAPARVSEWQQYMMKYQVRQPFRQVFREVYRLSDSQDPEQLLDETFAGHITDHHLMNTYSRNWWSWWDLRKSYAMNNLEARLSYERIENPECPPGRTGKYYTRSGSIGFYRNVSEQVPLLDIPPVVYSETLNDIGFFIQNASIGNDPAWEGVGDAEFRAAWHRFAFGKLLASAEIRKIVLKFIVPQLSLADKVSVERDFLVVNHYKIHIGSGQVLKAPDDTFIHLKLSGDEMGLDELYMPIERDQILYSIIAKAFILIQQ